jgi:ribosomal protein L25 (general stress protein Ctc)
MKAMIYEYLVCAAYNTERHGARGKADADVYRDMEHALREVELQKEAIKKRETPVSTKSVDQLEYDARVATATVRENVSDAIGEALRNTKLKYATEE